LEAETGGSQLESNLGKVSKRPYQKNKQSKKTGGHASSARVPVSETQDSEFNPQY
jgi:hypothetical protein